ncbi:hypothetical protein H6F89_27955 [Cyanobacteria bacterium FACHB-63]|nr:hypothetical protein [Cyanobacteria bacterium FACHB-63]
MNDQSMANQGATPNQAALEAQQTISGQTHAAGGSALLDANAQVDPQLDDSSNEPVASNLSGDQETDDPTEAKQFTTTGNYPVDLTQLDDEGNLSLTTDAPSAE